MQLQILNPPCLFAARKPQNYNQVFNLNHMKQGTCLQTHVSARLKPGMTGFISTPLLICHIDRGSNLWLAANELNMLREKNLTFSLFIANSHRILLKSPVCYDNINHMKTTNTVCIFRSCIKKKKKVSSTNRESERQRRQLLRLRVRSDL